MNKESIALTELQTRLINRLTLHPDSAVVINADKDVSHGRVIAIMDRIRETGITKMAIATKPEMLRDTP